MIQYHPGNTTFLRGSKSRIERQPIEIKLSSFTGLLRIKLRRLPFFGCEWATGLTAQPRNEYVESESVVGKPLCQLTFHKKTLTFSSYPLPIHIEWEQPVLAFLAMSWPSILLWTLTLSFCPRSYCISICHYFLKHL